MSNTKKHRIHVNRVRFEGTLCTLDVPSDRAPSGARGHRVILTTAAAEEALDSLEGMGVNIKGALDGHAPQAKVGIIEEGFIEDGLLKVRGFIYARDFPQVVPDMKKAAGDMGMSYEVADAHVEDMRKDIWTLTEVTFCGAAILLWAKAAYGSSRINIEASADEAFTGHLSFDDGDMKLVN